MQQYPLGEIVIQRVVESVCKDFAPLGFFPETTPEDWAQHRKWMEPHALDPVSGNLVLIIQAFLVRTRHHTILVDTCVGDHKSRPHRPFWHLQKLNTFLPRLAAAGVNPEDVDYVMCTHLHWDHVGWNTQLRDGRWVPTFPNAKYIFAQEEWENWEQLHARRAAAAAYRQRVTDDGSGSGATRPQRFCARRRSLAGANARPYAGPCQHPPRLGGRAGDHHGRLHSQPGAVSRTGVDHARGRRSGSRWINAAQVPRALLRQQRDGMRDAFPGALHGSHHATRQCVLVRE